MEKNDVLYNSLKYLEGIVRQLDNIIEQLTRVKTALKSYVAYAEDDNFQKDVGGDTKQVVGSVSMLMKWVAKRVDEEIDLISAERALAISSINFLKDQLRSAGDSRIPAK